MSTFTSDEIEAGRRLFTSPWDFATAASSLASLPPMQGLEIAFAGRSNVGKSSLINALTGRKALARTSHTPGRTRQLNFFDLGGRLLLVDLPGYGYAAAPKQAIARWTRLIERYLRGRASLLRVLVLLDARFGVKETDEPGLRLLDEAAVSFQVVLTKADLVEDAALAALLPRLGAMLARHAAAHPVIHITSAARGLGIAALRGAVATLAAERGAR